MDTTGSEFQYDPAVHAPIALLHNVVQELGLA
jgi:hypothetical protein